MNGCMDGEGMYMGGGCVYDLCMNVRMNVCLVDVCIVDGCMDDR